MLPEPEVHHSAVSERAQAYAPHPTIPSREQSLGVADGGSGLNNETRPHGSPSIPPPIIVLRSDESDTFTVHRTPHPHDADPLADRMDEAEGEGRDESKWGASIVVCGRRMHLSLVRSYYAPGDVRWGEHSMATTLFGLLYTDRAVSDQFVVFYKRSFVTLFVGVLYVVGLVTAGTVPLITRRFMWPWLGDAVAMLLCVAVDGWLHFFGALSPALAKVRMAVSLSMCVVLVGGVSWLLWPGQAHCDEANLLSHYPGRKVFDDTRDLLRHCRASVETIPLITGFCSLGVAVHPVAFLPLMAVFVFLNLYVARVVADVEEPTSERLVKYASLLLVSAGATVLTLLQFFAARAAFEATIRIEVQRQEAARRAAELEHLLTTIVPAAVLPRLLAGGDGQFAIDDVECASMLFADMKGFTAWSSSRTAVQVTSMLNTVVAAVDKIAAAAVGVEKVKTVGDAYWAVAGIPEHSELHADRLVVFAWHMNAAVVELNRLHPEWDGVAWRVAVHSGPMTGALFGERQVSYEVFGETARIAQVVEANGIPNSLCVTQAVLDAMFHPPPDAEPRLHRSLAGELPHDHVLDIFELPPPHLAGNDSITSIVHGTSTTLRSHSLTASTIVSPQHSATSSRRGSTTSSVAVTPTNRRRRRPARSPAHIAISPGTQQLPQLLNGAEPSHDAVSRHNTGRLSVAKTLASQQQSDGAVNEEAAAEMAHPRWRFLPWFADEALEAAFKARCETVTRPNARAVAVLALCAHALSMGAGFGEQEVCFTAPSLALQSIAAVGFVAALVITIHPTGPLAIGSALTLAMTSLSVIGLALAVLGGCYFAHDVFWLGLLLVIPQCFAIGPLSWPTFTAAVWVGTMVPGLPFTMLRSPFGPSNTILGGIAVGVLSACLAHVEETSLRRRFIEEELSRRCERQLQELGAERVEVLQRLVPSHVVDDLIEWFGTGMDPQRSIARTYDHVVVAFLQLRPEITAALPRLHAEIDRDLETANQRALQARPIADADGVVHGDLSGDSSPRERSELLPPSADAPSADAASKYRSGHRHSAIPVVRPSGEILGESPQPLVLDKIKTVGDVVMLAGPFTALPGHGDNAASDDHRGAVSSDNIRVLAAFAAVLTLARSVQTKCPLRAGVHVGPVVGTVQGSSRLAFDTFGDAVNVASRVMSSASASAQGCLRVSSDLHAVLTHGPTEVHFGESVTIHAKGKGDLTVHPVPLHPRSREHDNKWVAC